MDFGPDILQLTQDNYSNNLLDGPLWWIKKAAKKTKQIMLEVDIHQPNRFSQIGNPNVCLNIQFSAKQQISVHPEQQNYSFNKLCF